MLFAAEPRHKTNLPKFSVTYMACSVDLKAIEHVARPGKTGVIV
jgi:hypothetical protein